MIYYNHGVILFFFLDVILFFLDVIFVLARQQKIKA